MKTLEYSCALCAAITLMVFFGVSFIFGKLPDKAIYKTYRESRLLMGFAMLELSANYCVHFFVSPRFFNLELTIYMNLCTYFLSAWLFSCAMMHLMVRGYYTRRRTTRHLVAWVAYCLVSFIALTLAPAGMPKRIVLLVMSVVFLGYSGVLAHRLFVGLRTIKAKLDSYHSDDLYAYVRWMSVFTYWAMVYGVGQGLFTFIPDRYVVYWILSSIPFYVYLYVSYKNYLLFFEQVETVSLAADEPDEMPANVNETVQAQENVAVAATAPASAEADEDAEKEAALTSRLEQWIARREFARNGLTIVDLARDLGTNRTYVSTYINAHYRMSFREWVNALRINYAKELLTTRPDYSVATIAQEAGYMSLSHFSKTFAATTGVTPGKWRRDQPKA